MRGREACRGVRHVRRGACPAGLRGDGENRFQCPKQFLEGRKLMCEIEPRF